MRVDAALLEKRVKAALEAAGAAPESVAGAVRAMMHASRLGIDSHGVRLVSHYARGLRGGRLNPQPQMNIRRTGAGSAIVDADNGMGHAAAFAGMDLACTMAREAGVGAVGVVRSSHFGSAGAYAMAGANAGLIALVTTNADSFVALHDGAAAFHGTNPIAAAAPVPDQRPWLLDTSTSSIPFNRVLLYKALGRELPFGVAADESGKPVISPNDVRMLMPLGGMDFGFKGAGLAGLVTLLSAILTGANVDCDIVPMFAGDFDTPRNLGHFCLAIDPERFVGRKIYETSIVAYLNRLRNSAGRDSKPILAPGDREWAVETERADNNIPIDFETASFLGFAGESTPTERFSETL